MSDAYVDSMLGDGESVLAEGRQHWMALIRFALQPILVFIAAFVCLGIGIWLDPTGDGLFNQVVRWIDTLLGLFTLGLFILAVFWFPIQVVRWIKRRFLVTDRRVLYVEGVLRRNSRDAGLPMITDVGFRQTFLGRKLGYGDLVIATAANRPLDFRQMRDAISFKKVIMAAQQGTVVARADEILEASGMAPIAGTAPAVAAAAAPAVAVAAPAVAAAAVVEAAAEPVWEGSDVPQMAEDDLPPADPLIFGTPEADEAVEAAPEAVAEVAEVAGAAEGAPEAVVEVAAETTEATEASQDVVEAAPVAVFEVAAGATEATEETEAAAEAAPVAVFEVAAEATEETEAAAEAAPVAVFEVAAEATEAEAAETVQETAPIPAESATAALEDLAALRDSGTITEAEFETRKRELLDQI